MVFFGLFNLINLRMNLSVVIVAMTQKVNMTIDDGTIVEKQDFDWDSKTQGLILSKWTPVYERSFLASIAYMGNYAGTIGAMLLSGV
uniref:Major facilitator superfamily (MFS) profile domain-containing protein n=1 Tax=Phlebotomus papatasi TaxID=29031 RepID=A0A1B0D9F7_PHLPP